MNHLFNTTKYFPTDCKKIEQVPSWIDANLKTYRGLCKLVDGKLISTDINIEFNFSTSDFHLQVDQKL